MRNQKLKTSQKYLNFILKKRGNDMNGEAVVEIKNLTKEAIKTVVIDGKTYSTLNLKRVIDEPMPKSLSVNTLKGFCDYIIKNNDSLDLKKVFVVVDSHNIVSLVSSLTEEGMNRRIYLMAELEDSIKRFPFDQFIDSENFLIKMRSMFKETEDAKTVMKFSSALKISNTIETEDDGCTQTAMVKRGLSGAVRSKEAAPVIVSLKPYRTFPDIDQPESDFLFRMRADGANATCGLFEADGGHWRYSAKDSIANYLTEKLVKEGIDIGIIS